MVTIMHNLGIRYCVWEFTEQTFEGMGNMGLLLGGGFTDSYAFSWYKNIVNMNTRGQVHSDKLTLGKVTFSTSISDVGFNLLPHGVFFLLTMYDFIVILWNDVRVSDNLVPLFNTRDIFTSVEIPQQNIRLDVNRNNLLAGRCVFHKNTWKLSLLNFT